MAFAAGFATVADLKTRLGITDATRDAELADLLINIAGAIEAEAGRPLRRGHGMTEHLTGGGPLIRVDRSPIVAIHWVRESDSGDFETAGEYEELTRGTDYELDFSMIGKRYGGTPWLRRLAGNWLGDEDHPGQVAVCYTGGYKTDDEVALENASATVVASAAFSVTEVWVAAAISARILRRVSDTTIYGGWTADGATKYNQYGIFLFDLSAVVLATWQIFAATFRYTRQAATGGAGTAMRLLLLEKNPITQIADLAAYLTALQVPTLGGKFFDGTCVEESLTTTDHLIHQDIGSAIDPAANLALLNQTMQSGGFAAVLLDELDGTYADPWSIEAASPTHATTTYRPQLLLTHRVVVVDPYSVPDDLRHASLIQAAYDAVAYNKPQGDLLPEVVRVAQKYADLY